VVVVVLVLAALVLRSAAAAVVDGSWEGRACGAPCLMPARLAGRRRQLISLRASQLPPPLLPPPMPKLSWTANVGNGEKTPAKTIARGELRDCLHYWETSLPPWEWREDPPRRTYIFSLTNYRQRAATKFIYKLANLERVWTVACKSTVQTRQRTSGETRSELSTDCPCPSVGRAVGGERPSRRESGAQEWRQ